MDDTIRKQKQEEDRKNKTSSNHKKLFLILIAILFFSGIAILSVILESPKSQWALAISDPLENLPMDSSQRTANASGSVSSIPKASRPDSGYTFPVYIVGEICVPGIYQLDSGMFLYQLVEMAGGLTERAAKNRINLAFKITKNQMIKIPSQEEMDKGEIGGAAEGLLLDNEAGLDENAEQQDSSARININTANEEMLDKLPGIGAATAKRIIDYRNKNGNFKAIEDIMKIPGIKQNKFTQIKDRITV